MTTVYEKLHSCLLVILRQCSVCLYMYHFLSNNAWTTSPESYDSHYAQQVISQLLQHYLMSSPTKDKFNWLILECNAGMWWVWLCNKHQTAVRKIRLLKSPMMLFEILSKGKWKDFLTSAIFKILFSHIISPRFFFCNRIPCRLTNPKIDQASL